VAGGFARNFLLPEGRAIVATDGVEGQAEQMRRGRDLREAKDRGAAESQATILAGAVIPISARAGGGGRLFGSIGPADVVEAIRAAKGVEIDRKHVLLPSTSRKWAPSTSRSSCSPGVATVVTLEVTAAS
jgi:large subunit ribosomal protein L9